MAQNTVWTITYGDILDIPAEVLITSANPQLNMSGGVGGAILVRYGDVMQKTLHHYLETQNLSHVPQGSIIRTDPCNTPYRFVLHAVAINVFYESSPEILMKCIHDSLAICDSLQVKSIALTALATGYGRFSLSEFGKTLKIIMYESWNFIEMITVCLQNNHASEELQEYLEQ